MLSLIPPEYQKVLAPLKEVLLLAGQHMRRVLFLAAALAFALPSSAEILRGKVVHAADGDTVTVLDAQHVQHRIRLAGIDAPEKGGQAFGQRAKESLAAQVAGKQVEVVWDKRDRYGRIIGKVLVAPDACTGACRKTDAGLRQIEAGMAWHYKQYAAEQLPKDRARYAAEEENARAKRLGLWADPHPTPPWEWRREHAR